MSGRSIHVAPPRLRYGRLVIDDLFGRLSYPVTIVGETRDTYRVEPSRGDIPLPGGVTLKRGWSAPVRKSAVIVDER